MAEPIIEHRRTSVLLHQRRLPMPLTNDYEKAATLLLRGDDGGNLRLAGTAFAVMRDSDTFGPELKHVYLVTAGHVVQGPQPVYARVRLLGGSLRDQRIDNWIHHPNHDIAVAPLQDDAEVDVVSIPVETFTDQASLGDVVFFIGLLRRLARIFRATSVDHDLRRVSVERG
jgi:hypothetical protein